LGASNKLAAKGRAVISPKTRTINLRRNTINASHATKGIQQYENVKLE
jgi:hypothetical protein